MSARPIRVSIAGVTAYTGQEAARLVAGHPKLELVSASSDALAGRRVDALIPDLGLDGQATIVGHGDAAMAAQDHGAELALLATPPRRCAEMSAALLGEVARRWPRYRVFATGMKNLPVPRPVLHEEREAGGCPRRGDERLQGRGLPARARPARGGAAAPADRSPASIQPTPRI